MDSILVFIIKSTPKTYLESLLTLSYKQKVVFKMLITFDEKYSYLKILRQSNNLKDKKQTVFYNKSVKS